MIGIPIWADNEQDKISHGLIQRPGAVTLISLVTTICLLMIGMLMVGMANSSHVTSQRRADAVTRSYACESVANEFVACLDSAVSQDVPFDDAVMEALDEIGKDGSIGTRTTTVIGDGTCDVVFPCGDKRQLEVTVVCDDEGSIAVSGWRLRTRPSDEPSIGTLFGM